MYNYNIEDLKCCGNCCYFNNENCHNDKIRTNFNEECCASCPFWVWDNFKRTKREKIIKGE